MKRVEEEEIFKTISVCHHQQYLSKLRSPIFFKRNVFCHESVNTACVQARVCLSFINSDPAEIELRRPGGGGVCYVHPFVFNKFWSRKVLVMHCFFLFSTFYQVFTISKDLVPRVLSRVVEAVSEELSRLMQCVSSFSKNGALQVPQPLSSVFNLVV